MLVPIGVLLAFAAGCLLAKALRAPAQVVIIDRRVQIVVNQPSREPLPSRERAGIGFIDVSAAPVETAALPAPRTRLALEAYRRTASEA